MPKTLELSKQEIIDLRYALKYAVLSDEESISGVVGQPNEMDKQMIEQWKSNLLRFQTLDKKLLRFQVWQDLAGGF